MYKNICWYYWKKKIHPRAVYLNIFTKYKSSGEFTKSITTALIHNYNVISAHKSGVFFIPTPTAVGHQTRNKPGARTPHGRAHRSPFNEKACRLYALK